jgi:hypothetical protein
MSASPQRGSLRHSAGARFDDFVVTGCKRLGRAQVATGTDRDGQELLAKQSWRQALAGADHLAVLHAIWTAETAPARSQRYQELLTAVLRR